MCKYVVTVSSPANLTGVTASLNNIPLKMETTTQRKFASAEKEFSDPPNGEIEIDIHVRGRRNAGITITVTNSTADEDIFVKKDVIGKGQSADTRYDITDKVVKSKCV